MSPVQKFGDPDHHHFDPDTDYSTITRMVYEKITQLIIFNLKNLPKMLFPVITRSTKRF